MYEQKKISWEEYQKEQKQEMKAFKALPLEERLEKTIEKMIRIVRADTGGSAVYADMLLSLLPNSEHKVNMSYWCYKADRDDFYTILEIMKQIKEGSQIIWEYEKLVSPYLKKLKQIAKGK